MEKQIKITQQKNDITSRINTLIGYLKLYVDYNDKIICNCTLNAKQSNIFDDIKHLEQSYNIEISEIATDKRHYQYNIGFYLKNVEPILNVIEKYELNVMLFCKDIKLFINDNDGDFIIINSNHAKYDIIKKRKSNYVL